MITPTIRSEVTAVKSSSGTTLEHFIGSTDSLGRGPQCFLVSTPPGYVIEPHFHPVDQFQVFTGGSGRIGKRDLAPVTVHYTDGFTPYGPIIAAEDGMVFYNFRARADIGAMWMPESKDRMVRRAGRAITSYSRLELTPDANSMCMQAIIDPQDDGLLALEIVVGPGRSLIDEIVGGSGRYQLVVAGSLEYGSHLLPAESAIFASAGEVLVSRRAGPEGLHLMEFQLPID